MYPAPPAARSSGLRPGRGWYVFAVVIALVMILIGGGGFGYGIVTAIRSAGVDQRFGPGQSITTTWDGGRKPAIYAEAPGSGSGEPAASCRASDTSGRPIELTTPGGTFTTMVAGHSWRHLYVLEPGGYPVTFGSSTAGGFELARHAGKIQGGVLGYAAVLLMPAWVFICVIIAMIKRLRRLIAERFPPRH